MPDPVLNDNETLLRSFSPNRATYIREHIMLAAIGSVVVTGVLVYSGNPDPWVGVVASVAAIAVRGFYVFSEAMAMTWHLTDQRLLAPDGRTLPLSRLTNARRIFSAVQVIGDNGDKYLIKYIGHDNNPISTILTARDTKTRGRS